MADLPQFPSWLVDVCTGLGAVSLTSCVALVALCCVKAVQERRYRRRALKQGTAQVVDLAERFTREAAQ